MPGIQLRLQEGRIKARPAGSEVRRTSEELLRNMEHGVGHREMCAASRRNTTQSSAGYMRWNYQQRADPGGAVDVGDRLEAGSRKAEA